LQRKIPMRWSILVYVWAMVLGPSVFVISASAPIPPNDFRISQNPDVTANLGAAVNADVAFNPNTEVYLVVWEGQEIDSDPLQYEIYGQLLAADGSEIGGDFQISFTTGSGGSSSVAREPAVTFNEAENEFLVVWFSDKTSPFDYDIFGRRIDSFGTLIGADSFLISKMDYPSFSKARRPDVVWNADENQYLAVWQGISELGSIAETSEIYGQLLEADGTRIAPYGFRISTMGNDSDSDYTTVAQSPAVVYNTNHHEYLVVWEGDDADINETYRSEIYGQRLDASANEIGVDFIISEMGASNSDDFIAVLPDVAYNPTNDEYMVVWQGEGTGTDDEFEIFAQRLDSAGTQINTGPMSGNNDFVISEMGPAGDPAFDAQAPKLIHVSHTNQYFVAWSADHDFSTLWDDEFEIYCQFLDAAGNEFGVEERLSDMGDFDGNTIYDAYLPALAAQGNEVLVVWSGDDESPGDDDGEIWGQLYEIPVTNIEVNPLSLAFGDQNIHLGATAQQTVTITNVGTGTLSFTGITLLTGTDFAIASDSGEVSLEPSDTRTIEIVFDPGTIGPKTDILNIISNDSVQPTIDVNMDGIGVEQNIEIVPLSLDFGDQDVEAGATLEQTITISNNGSGALIINSVTLEDLSRTPDEFIIVYDSGEGVLHPTETRTVEISFDPIYIGPSDAACRIDSDDPDSPIVDVELRGNGLPPEYVHIPDPSYKACLIATYDTITPDGEISVSEALNIADVNCQSMGIEDITGTQEFPNLVSLNIADNLVTDLPDLTGLTSLLYMDCAYNLLQSMEITVSVLAIPGNLSWLYLQGNQIQEVPPILSDLQYLVELDLSQNQIASLPDIWHLFYYMESLYLENNQLTELPPGIGMMPALLDLYISENRLRFLPPFDPASPLVSLLATDNFLDSLPNLQDLADLEQVLLSSNRLTDLEPFVLHPNLGDASPHILHVDRNFLTLDNCPDITTLELRFSVSDAEFIYNPQGNYTSIWPSLPLWPTENVLYFVDLINSAYFEYILVCPALPMYRLK